MPKKFHKKIYTNQKIYDKQLEIQTLEVIEQGMLTYINKAEEELKASNKRYEKQKKLLERENALLEVLNFL